MVTQFKQQDASQEIEEILSQAIRKHKEGEIEAAISWYLESLKIDENQPDWVYGNIITLLAQVDRLAQGLSFKEKALKIHPLSDEIYRALGLVLNQQNDLKNAIDCYQKSLELNQEQPDWLYSSLIEMLVKNEQFQEAIAVGNLGLKFHGDFAWLNYHLAEAFSAEENWDKALIYYSKAEQIQPDLPNIKAKINLATENIEKQQKNQIAKEKSESLSAQAIAKHKEGAIEAAINLYLESLEIDENQPDWVYGNLITLLAQVDRIEQGLSLKEKALKIHPLSDEIYRALGLVFNKQNDLENAIDCYQKSLELNQEQPNWLYSSLIEMLVEHEQFQEAIAIGNLGLKFHSDFAWLNYHLAEAFSSENNWDEALIYYSKAGQIQPDLPNIEAKVNLATENIQKRKNQEKSYSLFTQAIAKHKEGEIEAAIDLYLESLEIDENQPEWVYSNLITLLAQGNRVEQGLSLREKALKLHPESDEIYRALGLAFNQQKDLENAIDCYKKSLELNQEQPDWLYSSLTEMLVKDEQFQEAIAIGHSGLEFHNDCAWLNYHLAGALSAEEDWKKALTYYSKAERIQSDLPNIQAKINLATQNIQQQKSEEKSESLAAQAIAKHQEGKIEAAIDLYLESLEIDENQPEWVYSNLITLLAQGNRVEQGLSLREKALKLHTESDEIYRALGLAFNQQKDLEKAIDCYKKSLELNQEQPNWLYSSLTEMLVKDEQFQEAIAVGNLGLKFHSDFAWLNYHLAGALSAEKKWHEALTYYSKAEQIQPDLPNIKAKVNLVTENVKKIDDQSLEKKSHDYQAQAVIKHKAGQTEAAIALYLQSIEINEEQADWVYGNIITLLTQNNQVELAIDIGLKAEKLYPQSDEIYRARALLFDKKNDDYNAIQLYQKAFDINPKQPDWCYLNFAQKLLEIESIKETLELTNKGLEYYPNYYYLNYIQAQAFAVQKRWDEAIAAYIYVQDQNPGWLEVEEKLTQTVYQKNKLERSHHISYNRQESEKITSFWLNSKATKQVELVRDENALDKLNNLNVYSLFREVKNSEKDLIEFQSICKVNAKYILDLNYGCWLNSYIIYLEASVDNYEIKEDVELLITDSHEYLTTKAKFLTIADNQIIGIACFDKDSCSKIKQDCHIYLNTENQLVTSNKIRLHQAYNLELIEHLKTKSDSQKNLIREKLSDFLINLVSENIQEDVSNLLSKLQYFLDIKPINSVGISIPFNISIDNVISLENQSLFISGWLRDDYKMLQEIRVISSLGLSWDLAKEDILTLERQENKDFLQENSLGFVIYTQVPQNIHDSIAKWTEIHSFRFVVKLKGDIEIEIVPETKHEDIEAARTAVIQIAEPNKISEDILEQCLAPTAFKLQQLLTAQIKIKNLTVIGKPVEKPLVSIIIPLYRRLDFLKVQFSAIANDPTIKQQCEIIYVLDSPEQESEVSKFLNDHAKLYELPVTLIVMAKNSGYASANNIGASQARGKYLLLLNSDVFPKTEGWALKMANFYESSPKVGVLGAKLVYEDNSLQHAGLFFEQTSCSFWNIRHCYKGLPETYELAQQNRAVPAVTGACLMIEKDLYEQVGGLTTDYIIGYFEDSDLCLKCSAKGYESWYFADATLYHLERQSIHLHPVYNQSLAWHLNGYLHNKKWKNQISKLINCNQ